MNSNQTEVISDQYVNFSHAVCVCLSVCAFLFVPFLPLNVKRFDLRSQ